MKPFRFCISVVLCACAALFCHSCDRAGFIPADTDEIIVEGWIEEGQFPIVMLTRSLPVRLKDQEVNLNRISDYVVLWAKVTVSNGSDSVLLTGKVDNGYLPSFIYTTSDTGFKGEAGRTYTLRVETDGKTLTSSTTIPLYPPAVDSVVCTSLPTDTSSAVTVYVSNIPDRKEYYKVFFRQGSDRKQFSSAYLGIVDDALADSAIVIPVFKSVKDDNKEDQSRFFPNDTLVSIKVSAIGKESYDFWFGYSNNSSFGSLSNLLFGSSFRDIPTNITGGRGYWFGYNSFVRTFHVRPGTFPGNR